MTVIHEDDATAETLITDLFAHYGMGFREYSNHAGVMVYVFVEVDPETDIKWERRFWNKDELADHAMWRLRETAPVSAMFVGVALF